MEFTPIRNIPMGGQREPGGGKDIPSAAKEFEALLIGQLLQSAFTSESDGADAGSQSMLDFGREHLSRVIAEGGGLGLAKLIQSGLAKEPQPSIGGLLKR